MRERGRRLLGREGTRNGRWALLDFGDVVLHVFYHPVRGDIRHRKPVDRCAPGETAGSAEAMVMPATAQVGS